MPLTFGQRATSSEAQSNMPLNDMTRRFSTGPMSNNVRQRHSNATIMTGKMGVASG